MCHTIQPIEMLISQCLVSMQFLLNNTSPKCLLRFSSIHIANVQCLPSQ